MRFLCFHGAGTNAKIFEVQTEKIRQKLGRHHEFVFLNGTVPAQPAHGLESKRGEFFRFAREDKREVETFVHQLIQFVKVRGPFDGVVGFSEGGAAAAGALIEDAAHPFGHFKCGIFFCAAVPFKLDLARNGRFQSLSAAVDGVLIKVPTAHIWSNEGGSHPGMGKDLALLCEPSMRSEYVHKLGHDVPGSRSDDFLSGTVRVIERTIERAR